MKQAIHDEGPSKVEFEGPRRGTARYKDSRSVQSRVTFRYVAPRGSLRLGTVLSSSPAD